MRMDEDGLWWMIYPPLAKTRNAKNALCVFDLCLLKMNPPLIGRKQLQKATNSVSLPLSSPSVSFSVGRNRKMREKPFLLTQL